MSAVLLDWTNTAGNRQSTLKERLARHWGAEYAQCLLSVSETSISLVTSWIELARRAILVS